MFRSNFIKRSLPLLLAITLLLGMLPVSAFAAAAERTPISAKVTEVATATQLEQALKAHAPAICITSDITADRTFYVTANTVIFTREAHTVRRAANFGGDIFVVGENKAGNSALLNGSPVELTLGDPASYEADLLTLDGNKDAMEVDVVGTMLFVAESSVVNIYDNVAMLNAHKVGNKKVLKESYEVSYNHRIGGAAVIIVSGSVNIYGGTFSGNVVNDENTASEEGRVSSVGGAIYNYGNLKVYGGTFSDNQAARGGAIYNYRTLKLLGGSFENNNATAHGGAIALAGSQYAQMMIGQAGDSKGADILFKENTSAKNGGAIYFYTAASLLIYGGVTFEGNQAVSGSGGAICCYNAFNITNATFIDNTAYHRGGAIYLSNASEERSVRYSYIQDSSFEGGIARQGGAIGIYAAEDTMQYGANAEITRCTFTDNLARNDVRTDDQHGGAIYIGRKSNITLSESVFTANSAVEEGGALYITDESNAIVENTDFINNASPNGHGGGVVVRSSYLGINGGSFEGNTAKENGAGLYVSYIGTSTVNSTVEIDATLFDGNEAEKYGGAIYVTEHEVTEDARILTLQNATAQNNTAKRGGAMYLTSGSETLVKETTFSENHAISDEDGNGGAVAIYSGSSVTLYNVKAIGNTADGAAGFLYNSGSDVTVYDSTLTQNQATKGGALSLHSEGTTKVYGTLFEKNEAGTHGGAAYVYPGATETLMQKCTFNENTAADYGGALYVSNKGILNLYDNIATNNKAGNGGFLYETTTDTTATINGITLSGNTATKGGPIIWGNTTKAYLSINKTNYTDSDVDELTADYWNTAIANKLTVTEITDAIPTYTPYQEPTTPPDPVITKKPVPVRDVLSLGLQSSDKAINDTYGALPLLNKNSNFMSRNTTAFENINGGTVTVDSFVYEAGKKSNNTNVGEGLLIYQAILYKQKYPNKKVSIDISAFRFSVEAAVCINRDSRYFGYMRNLVGQEYDEYGFVRISYLLVTAAKMGIHVTVIGQMDGYPISEKDPNFIEYFTEHLSDPCDPAYVKNGKVSDYMNYQFCYWTSYGDNDATDMMHVKMCAVSNYLDMNGKAHKNAIYSTSANLDGIQSSAANGNSDMQTGIIISNHEALYRTTTNYLRLLSGYCGQEDVYRFRELVTTKTADQIDLILSGKADEIPADEQIVYLGSEKDDVFELYFAPFGGDKAVWNENYNPYCKYLRAMYNSEDYILLLWNNANYQNSFALGRQMETIISGAFHNNKNKNNRVYLNLESFDASVFDDLTVGKNIGYKSFNSKDVNRIHSKDMQLSYVQNGQRYYVSLLNSLNIHGGSMSYQANAAIVIKETSCDTNSVFNTIARYTSTDMANEAIMLETKDTTKVFSDVKNKWYKNAIDYCYTNEYILGMSKTQFGINTPVTRGMFITVLARMAGVDTSDAANKTTTVFTDVASGAYYTAAIKWAKKTGVVAGISATEFAPDALIQRQQICVMLSNFANYQGITIDKKVAAINFKDAANIAAYAKSAVTICQCGDIITGYTDGTFLPKATATRAEAAQMLYNFHINFA